MLKEIFEDLDFIASIPRDAKPNFSDKTLVYNDEWFTTFRRRMKFERGEKGIVYIETLIEEIKIYDKSICLNFEDQKILKEKLIGAKEGLDNLVQTYINDNQHEVANSYKKCGIKLLKLIDKYSHVNKKFFGHCPNIIH